MNHLCVDGPTAPIDLLLRTLEAITGGYCCMGAAENGFDRCTCWEPIYDKHQDDVLENPPWIIERTTMCDDCAFRPDSPERQGDERYNHAGDDELRELEHFWCHQGMRKPVAYRHPYGITLDADHDAYDPPQRIINGERVPFKADGTPGDRCAGFAALRRIESARG